MHMSTKQSFVLLILDIILHSTLELVLHSALTNILQTQRYLLHRRVSHHDLQVRSHPGERFPFCEKAEDLER